MGLSGPLICSCCSSKKAGVIVSFNNTFTFQISRTYCDPGRRFIICDLITTGKQLTLANLYAPNNDDSTFFTSVFERLATEAYRCHPTSNIRHPRSDLGHPRFDIRHSTSLGARGFSCAVSAFGQDLKVTRAKSFAARVFGLRPNTCRPVANETKLPVAREKKTSSIQGNIQHPRFDIRHPTSYIPDLKRIRVRCTFPNEGAHRGDKHSQKCKMIKILKKPE